MCKYIFLSAIYQTEESNSIVGDFVFPCDTQYALETYDVKALRDTEYACGRESKLLHQTAE